MCTETEMTIQHFVDYLLETENLDGKRWLENYIKSVKEITTKKTGFKKTLRNIWENYSLCPITSESLTSLMYGISAQVSFQIRDMADFQKLLEAAESFLEEVAAKGRERDLEPDQMAFEAIIVPRKFA